MTSELDQAKAQITELEAEVENLRGVLSCQECDTIFWKEKCQKTEAEVERLRADVDFQKQIVEETLQESKRDYEYHADRATKAEIEAERLRAHTWEQERAAVARWIRDTIYGPQLHDLQHDYLAERIQSGAHWPGGEKP